MQTIVTPVAAFTMATILFVWNRSSIHAAKRNAKMVRESDGGQINWKNEDLRRHGQIKRLEEMQSQASQPEKKLKARKIRRGEEESD